MLAIKEAKIPIKSIASSLNRDASTISSLISRFKSKCNNLPEIQNQMERVRIRAFEIAELQA
jgi:hypothetical protein